MELTISIKEQDKIAFFIKLLQEFKFVEIIDIKDFETIINHEHLDILEQRLKRIENGEATFKRWDLIKQKYEKEKV